ncbi:MAG TPA: Holliday junction resolvase RuvX [Rhodospirillaceae bacterium]|nr:Holliday junction resolvase RuvX [Rhodospirillaceae bacterium]
MPRVEPENFIAAVAANACLMALDVSPRRIGIAVTEPARTMALPTKTLIRGKWEADAATLHQFIQDHRIGGIVIGLPRNLDGSMGPADQSCLTFGRNLDNYLTERNAALPYTMVDESLTSHEARDILGDRKDTKNMEDQIAASLILQHFIKI